MDCNEVERLLAGYIDSELDLVTALEIENHLPGCADCSRQYAEVTSLRSLIGEASLYHPAPAGLQKRVRSSVRKANPAPPAWANFNLRWTAAALVLVLVAVLGGNLTRGWFIPGQQDRLTEEVQSAHVRSLMASHLTDVASSDQHTVKPWFNGKLDFSPPVDDLAAQGFPLIGGRLDYLDGHPVAALVYRRNKHDINLFVWPSADQGQELLASNKDGYNLYHWNRSGMTYWAVSDLNPQELQSFVELVQKTFK